MTTNNKEDNIKDFIDALQNRLVVDYPTAVMLLKTEGAYLAIEHDAELLNSLLDLPIREANERIPVIHTVFPLHAFDEYVGILNREDFCVAVCSQEPTPEGTLSPQLTLF